jgi:hypothetical protein
MRIEEAKQILRNEYPGKSISVNLYLRSHVLPYAGESQTFDAVEAQAAVHLDEIFIGYGPTFKAAIENLRTKVNPLIETPDIADDGNDPEHEEVTGAEITPAMRSEWSREAAAESLRGKP